MSDGLPNHIWRRRNTLTSMDTSVAPALLLVTWVLTSRPGAAAPPNISDEGVCNFTSTGLPYAEHVHSPTTVRSLAVPLALVTRPFFCFYTFRAAPNQRVLINIQQLAVGNFNQDQNSCDKGYVRLWDGIRQPGLYRYPPNTLCGIFTGRPRVQKFSTDHALEVELYHQDAHRRISLTFTFKYVNLDLELMAFPFQVAHDMEISTSSASVCYWEITWESCDSECTLMSPGYPGMYPPNIECLYHIKSSNEDIAYQLSFSGFNRNGKEREFDLSESKNDCLNEYVEVYDGPTTHFPMIGRFCGSDNVPDITSTGSDLLLVFASGPGVPPYGHRGFHASAQGITKEWSQAGERVDGAVCDWFYNVSQGSVTSPDHWLPRNTICKYTITVNPGNLLHLILTVYGLRRSCKDSIDIADGDIVKVRICRNTLLAREVLAKSRAKASQNGGIGEDPNTFIYQLNGPAVVVRYSVSDGQMGALPDAGFWLSFKEIPEPEVRKDDIHAIQSDEASPIRGYTQRPHTTASSARCRSHHFLSSAIFLMFAFS